MPWSPIPLNGSLRCPNLALSRFPSCTLLSQGPLGTVARTQGPPRSQSQNRPGTPTTWPGRGGGAETGACKGRPSFRGVAESSPLSLPDSTWGLRRLTGSLDPGSTPWVRLTAASSALPMPRPGARTASSGWPRPRTTLLPLQPPDRAREEGGAWR